MEENVYLKIGKVGKVTQLLIFLNVVSLSFTLPKTYLFLRINEL